MDEERERRLQPYRRETARRVLQFSFSVGLLERNFREFVLFLRYITSPNIAMEISLQAERWRKHEAMVEVMFLLHNYVAAVQSLIDHSRVLYRELYEPEGLIPQYQSEVTKRFVSDPLSQFIVGLRQMSQHYRLPIVHSSLDIITNLSGSATIHPRLLLSTEDLRMFDWKSSAKQFLDEAGDSIELADVVERHHRQMMAFYEWFSQEQSTVHGCGPAVYLRLTKYGVNDPRRAIIKELRPRVRALLNIAPEELSFGHLHDALSPALTINDQRLLMLCQHDVGSWIEHALATIGGRIELLEDLKEHLRGIGSLGNA
jgi:hypothetical protein